MKQSIFLLFVMIAVMACNSKPAACKHKPAPLFKADMAHVKGCSFHTKGEDSDEYVAFEEGFSLLLQQSGCDKVTQTFNFNMPAADYTTEPVWGEEAADLFFQLSGVDGSLMAMQDWAAAIGTHATEFSLSKPVLIENHYEVTINKVASADTLTIAVQIRDI